MNLISWVKNKIIRPIAHKTKKKPYKTNYINGQTKEICFDTVVQAQKPKLTDLEKKILSILKISKRYFKNQDISRLLQVKYKISLKDEEIRLIIRSLRLKGHLIIANCKGYFLTDDKKLIKKYIDERNAELRKEQEVLNEMLFKTK